jgi:hypothetical protein
LQAPAGITAATDVAGASATADASHNLSVPLLAARAQDRLQQQHREDGQEVDFEDSDSGVKSVLKEGLMLCIPTGFDLAATTLMNVGLLYVAASGKGKWASARDEIHLHACHMICGAAVCRSFR